MDVRSRLWVMLAVLSVCRGGAGCSGASHRGGDADSDVTADADAEAEADAGGDVAEDGDVDPEGDTAGDGEEEALVTYTETRAPCEDRNPARNVYFGDTHIHTAYSFDAWVFDVRNTPADAYRFARGEAVALPETGGGTRMVQLARPLDFAAVSDHSEFLGEVELCTVEGSPSYDSAECRVYRRGLLGFAAFGEGLTSEDPQRSRSICGPDGSTCIEQAVTVWSRIQEAAEGAYDRSASCGFTAFVAYEYTAMPGGSNLHRNVIFRNARVPPLPITYFEEPEPQGLWDRLRRECLDAGTGCEALAIPHNSNLSAGRIFLIEYPGAGTLDEEREQAGLRARIEPLVEIYQHKGASECFPGFGAEEECAFEVLPSDPCNGDGTGTGTACISRQDFVRHALLQGLLEQDRLGVNPFRLGIIASTDTHNGTPGNVDEDLFDGHGGVEDDLPRARLNLTPNFGPGGLAAVWAVENSRDALFEAMLRRETYATSGPRFVVRFFGGWSFEDDLCGNPDLVVECYASGVPMGGDLPSRPAGAAAPRFVVQALRDDVPLQVVQIVKGWLDGSGGLQQRVYDVAGDPDSGATVDAGTCAPLGAGADSLCATWADPDFDPDLLAFYYARVLENPTCRWSARDCLSLSPDGRPDACSDPAVPDVIKERAWTSPIWYAP